MRFRVLLSAHADADFDRLYDFVIERGDWAEAERAIRTIEAGLASLENVPYACRKAGDGDDPFLRELLIGFGGSGYVVLYRIDEDTVTVAAVRHQREDDYR